MRLNDLVNRAKQVVEKRGGTDALKEDAQELKNVASGKGSQGQGQARGRGSQGSGCSGAGGRGRAPTGPASVPDGRTPRPGRRSGTR